MFALMMTACVSSTVQSKIEIPADLTQPCPNLPELTGGTGKEVLNWSVQTVNLYKECQAKHNSLIKIQRNMISD